MEKSNTTRGPTGRTHLRGFRGDRNLLLRISPTSFFFAQLVRDLPLANKGGAGKPGSLILAQWTWKPSPNVIGIGADEHGREPVDAKKRKIQSKIRTAIRLLLAPLTLPRSVPYG